MMKQAQVIYYLSRAGALEHPHLIDVGYSEPDGLQLQDVKRRLVAIRGKGMPELFSWSYKTKYRNDFIWHDLSDSDVILPMNETEYILKGSEIVEGESSLHRCPNESEIQCKNMLREHCCLIKSPFHHRSELLAEECVIRTTNHPVEEKNPKVYKARTSSCGEEEDASPVLKPACNSPFEQLQSRGDKPLPCVNNRKEFPANLSMRDKTPPKKSVAALFGEPVSSGNVEAPKTRKTGGSTSLIFRQMLPCADIGTKAQVQNGLFNQGQKQMFGARENGFSSLRQGSTKALKKGSKLVSLSGDNGTKVSDGRHSHDLKPSLAFVRGNTTPSNKLQDEFNQRYSSSTLTRFKPRHSYSSSFLSSDHVDSTDLYWRTEKVKEVDNELAWPPRQSNASRVSVESLYEVDCKGRMTFESALEQQRREAGRSNPGQEDSPRGSLGSHIISKLLMDATKANEEKSENKDKAMWWEEVRTPRRENVEHERMRKNKLDWEKNLQEAVDMIIRPQPSVQQH